MPTTTAQFENVLEVFKQHGMIPLDGATIASGGWHSDPTNFLMDAFTYDPGFDADALFQVQGPHKLVFAADGVHTYPETGHELISRRSCARSHPSPRRRRWCGRMS